MTPCGSVFLICVDVLHPEKLIFLLDFPHQELKGLGPTSALPVLFLSQITQKLLDDLLYGTNV